jgi:lipopolysaccharide/colanic/teichoic acid biosynthesis glycosyltransferase
MKGSVSKKVFDFSLALLGLVISSPLWLVCALAIYIDDGGPVFYTQKRCGRGGKEFRLIKFRTMRLPKEGEARLDVDLENDPRVIRIGRVLRATALDELPTLLSILKGDMSFVGPKPLPFRIDDQERGRYDNITQVPGYHTRSQIKPGLTGLAQVYAPKDIERSRKFCYDNLYVKKMSFCLDLKLIFLSFWITFRGRWEHRERTG